MGIFDWVEDCFESLRSLPRKSAWKRYIPMPEVEAINILKRDLPPEAEVTITVEKKGSGWIKIKGAGINESRTFNFKRGVVNSGHMKVDSNKKGIGRHIMRNEIEFFATCGMKRFEICATSAAGGYAWARLGFLPDSCGRIREEVYKRFEDLEALLSEKDRRIVEKILEFKSPTDIWRLADNRLDLTVRLKEVFAKANCGDKTAKDIYKKISTDSETLEESFKKGEVQPLGRVLLAGTSWKGHMDFDNKQQMERVGQYVGGWQILKPAHPEYQTLAVSQDC